MISNTVLPNKLMKVLLFPMIKNITLFSSDSRNYRPNALPTAATKLFELILQNRITPYMYTSGALFGFKASHDTDMAIFFYGERKNISELWITFFQQLFRCNKGIW